MLIVKMENIEKIVSEMLDEFLMSEACSRFYSLSGNDEEAQDLLWFASYEEHALLCKKAASACREFLETKNIKRILITFTELELYGHMHLILNCYLK